MRRLLFSLLLLLAALPAAAELRVVNVYNWSDYVQRVITRVWTKFKTGK